MTDRENLPGAALVKYASAEEIGLYHALVEPLEVA